MFLFGSDRDSLIECFYGRMADMPLLQVIGDVFPEMVGKKNSSHAHKNGRS